MILKFVYRSKSYYGTENFFFADFEKKAVSDKSQNYDAEVVMAKSGELDELKKFFEERWK